MILYQSLLLSTTVLNDMHTAVSKEVNILIVIMMVLKILQIKL